MMSPRRTIAYARDGRRELTCLALFFYVFLAGVQMFDDRVGLFVAPTQVTAFEALILGASVVGFLLRPLLLYRTRTAFQIVPGIMSVLAAAALVVVLMAQQLGVALVGGAVGFCALGYTGSAAHAFVSRRYAHGGFLARTVALSYAGGVLLQFVCHTMLPAGIPQQFMLVVGAITMVVMLRTGNGPDTDGRGAARGPGADHGTVVRLVVATGCLTVMFALLDVACSMGSASGSVEFDGWDRLVLVASAIAAGHLFDIRRRGAMGIVMSCAAALSALSLIPLVTGGNVLVAMLLSHIGAGFFFVFFTTAFMALAPSTRCPELWPGMGHAVKNACSALIAVLVAACFGRGGVLAVAGVAAVACAVSIVALRRPFDVLEVPDEEPDSDSSPSNRDETPAEGSIPPEDGQQAAHIAFEEKLAAFGTAYGFSEREIDIMRALLTSEGSVKSVADALYLSRSTLYRHISAMNKKTGTASRMALITAFWSWDGR